MDETVDKERPLLKSFIFNSHVRSLFLTPLREAYGINKIVRITPDRNSGLIYAVVAAKSEEDNSSKEFLAVINGNDVPVNSQKRVHSIYSFGSKHFDVCPSFGINDSGITHALLVEDNVISKVRYYSIYGPQIKIDASSKLQEDDVKKNLKLTVKGIKEEFKASSSTEVMFRKQAVKCEIKVPEKGKKIDITDREE